MSSTTISQQPCPTVPRRTDAYVLVERVARRLLSWSARHQQARLANAGPSHERMALIRENERRRVAAGSSVGR